VTRSNPRVSQHKFLDITNRLKIRQTKTSKLDLDIQDFQKRVADRNQPAQKLHDATVHAARQRSIDNLLSNLKLQTTPVLSRDRRITLGSQAASVRLGFIILFDKFTIAQKVKSSSLAVPVKLSGGSPDQTAKQFFASCRTLIENCTIDNLPKLAVETSIYFAKIARLFEVYCHAIKSEAGKNAHPVEDAKVFLERALILCEQPFKNATLLRAAVEECAKSLRKEWYEEVSKEEIDAIKRAMVSGPKGISTHSGHWYNCSNGHPFAIGECGMPMERATCPECGSPVGGQYHEAVEGVTRARNME